MLRFVKQVKQIRKQQVAVCFAMGSEQTISFTLFDLAVPVAIQELFLYTGVSPSWFKATVSEIVIREFKSLCPNYFGSICQQVDEETFNLRIPVRVWIGPRTVRELLTLNKLHWHTPLDRSYKPARSKHQGGPGRFDSLYADILPGPVNRIKRADF